MHRVDMTIGNCHRGAVLISVWKCSQRKDSVDNTEIEVGVCIGVPDDEKNPMTLLTYGEAEDLATWLLEEISYARDYTAGRRRS